MTVLSDALAAHARNKVVEADALDQRVHLLDAIWADMQDDGRSAVSRLFPRELLPGHRRCPACISSYAVDLVRAHDGIWRVARLRVADHPGAVILQMPVLATFLPELCRALLGQSLRLASVSTWWLADRETLAMLAARPTRFRLRDATRPDRRPLRLRTLPRAARERIQRAIDRQPARFVAELDDEDTAVQTLRMTTPVAMWD